MLVYPKIAHEVLLIRAIFILEVYTYLVVAVTLKNLYPAMLVYPEIKVHLSTLLFENFYLPPVILQQLRDDGLCAQWK